MCNYSTVCSTHTHTFIRPCVLINASYQEETKTLPLVLPTQMNKYYIYRQYLHTIIEKKVQKQTVCVDSELMNSNE